MSTSQRKIVGSLGKSFSMLPGDYSWNKEEKAKLASTLRIFLIKFYVSICVSTFGFSPETSITSSFIVENVKTCISFSEWIQSWPDWAFEELDGSLYGSDGSDEVAQPNNHHKSDEPENNSRQKAETEEKHSDASQNRKSIASTVMQIITESSQPK